MPALQAAMPTRQGAIRCVSLVAAALMVIFGAPSLEAQLITGVLLDADTRVPVSSATVSLIGEGDGAVASVTTDGEGLFRIPVPGPGRYGLRSQRIGYATATTEVLEVRAADLLEVEVLLSTQAVPLAPLTVTVAARPWWEYERPEAVWGLYERMDHFGRTGFARFLTAEDLELQRLAPAWMILSNQLAFGIRANLEHPRTAERSIRIRGCSPLYFIDGLPFRAEEWVALSVIEDMVAEGRVEGIETYSPFYVPWEFHRHFITARGEACAIAVWTRAPAERGLRGSREDR